MKELKIEAPQGYEVDKENSTFDCIKFKKKYEIKTWDDFCREKVPINGFCIESRSSLIRLIRPETINYDIRNLYLTKKQAKSARAAAMISQLMPYYGGAITFEEWDQKREVKHTIVRLNNKIIKDYASGVYNFLAFRTREFRDEFLKNRGETTDIRVLEFTNKKKTDKKGKKKLEKNVISGRVITAESIR